MHSSVGLLACYSHFAVSSDFVRLFGIILFYHCPMAALSERLG